MLLASRVPLTIGATEVCLRHLVMTRAAARELLSPTGKPGQFLLSILEEYLDRFGDEVKSITGRPDAWPVWDLVTTAHLLGLTRTETYPRPLLRDDLTFEHTGRGGEVRWITWVDERRLWAEFARLLTEAGRAAAAPA